MKAILVIDMPEKFDYRKCTIGGDGNIYYERDDEQRASIIGNIKNLKPMPNRDPISDEEISSEEDYEVRKFCGAFDLGWNNCLDEIGEKE